MSPILPIGIELLHSQPRQREKLSNPKQWRWQPFDQRGAAAAMRGHRPRFPYAAQTNYKPSSRRQKVVLVFEAGVITRPLLEWLSRYEMKYFYLDFDQLIEQGEVTLNISQPQTSTLSVSGATLRLDDVAGVVWIPPNVWHASLDHSKTPTDIVLERWNQVLRDLRPFLGEAVWLPSDPFNGSAEWQNKLSELLLAKKAGLEVPDTICTNNYANSIEFIGTSREVLLREFTCRHFFPIRPFVGNLRRERIELSPCVFQRRIEKEYDVRAVVVGDKVLACRIDSQASAKASFDWRVYDNMNVGWYPLRLPRTVERSMIRLMKSLNLRLGSFDLVKARQGPYIFLEVNRPGAFYWLLPFAGLDVTREIVRYLRVAFAQRAVARKR